MLLTCDMCCAPEYTIIVLYVLLPCDALIPWPLIDLVLLALWKSGSLLYISEGKVGREDR